MRLSYIFFFFDAALNWEDSRNISRAFPLFRVFGMSHDEYGGFVMVCKPTTRV